MGKHLKTPKEYLKRLQLDHSGFVFTHFKIYRKLWKERKHGALDVNALLNKDKHRFEFTQYSEFFD